MKLKIIFCLFCSLYITAMERQITQILPTMPVTPKDPRKSFYSKYRNIYLNINLYPMLPLRDMKLWPIEESYYIYANSYTLEEIEHEKSPDRKILMEDKRKKTSEMFEMAQRSDLEYNAKTEKKNFRRLFNNEKTMRNYHEACFLYEIQKMQYPINMEKYKQAMKQHEDDRIVYLSLMAKEHQKLA